MSRRRCEAWTTANNYRATHQCEKDGKVVRYTVLGSIRNLCPLHNIVRMRNPSLLKFS